MSALDFSVGAQPRTGIGNAPRSYLNNRAPLRPNPFIELPLGAIRPEGWLREMLLRQKTGSTGHLDELYPLVMGSRNGWLGGDGDQWERGPYWIDGLLPLAYILDDSALIAKVKPWIEWAISSQQADGYFGPARDYDYERGVQRDNSHDWWPKMVMLKILKQYYSATQDVRVIKLLTNYFRYQLKELPAKPLDHWTFWALYRGADNLMVIYWLYNITGDRFLLQLADILYRQTFDFTQAFLKTDMLAKNGTIHCVNLAQGMKGPLIYYQQHPNDEYLRATRKGLADIRKYNGIVHGLYGGDEALHGNNPTQGSELCSAVEMMFTLESILPVTGETAYADQLERITFNALPTQISDDFMTRQYFQQGNQVLATRHMRNFRDNHGGTDVCYGLLTGYACCTSNMHQGWPKFTQNLWYATAYDGLAALVYAPSKVSAIVRGGRKATIVEETNYPFQSRISFVINIDGKGPASFPIQLRIPGWCNKASITINGVRQAAPAKGSIARIERPWKSGDTVQLDLPMDVVQTRWYENSVAVERGPLVYALRIEEEWKEVRNDRDPIEYGDRYFEVHPRSDWNLGLVEVPAAKAGSEFKVVESADMPVYPWNLESAPIRIIARARKIPSWKLYNDMAGPMPYSTIFGMEAEQQETEVTLIPYGCTTLRIAQFPVIGR